MTPLISVITATWNCGETIDEALDSIARQSWASREHIVVDGASRDHTLERLNARRSQITQLVSEPDRGIYDALNKGIAMAKGEVVGFLHADDYFASDSSLELIGKAFADPAVQAVYGDLEYVQKHQPQHLVRRWRSCPFHPGLLKRGWMPPHPTLYVRRHWYELLQGFDLRYRIAADYHCVLRLFSQPQFNAVYIPSVIVRMRVGGASNRSLGAIARKTGEDLDALRRTGVGGIPTLLRKNFSKIGQFGVWGQKSA